MIRFNQEYLCVAIIYQALKDLKYINDRIQLCKNNKKSNYEKQRDKIEKELSSEWCRSLTELDIDYLIKGVIDENKRVSRANKKI